MRRQRYIQCPTCRGTGRHRSGREICQTCRGRRHVTCHMNDDEWLAHVQRDAKERRESGVNPYRDAWIDDSIGLSLTDPLEATEVTRESVGLESPRGIGVTRSPREELELDLIVTRRGLGVTCSPREELGLEATEVTLEELGLEVAATSTQTERAKQDDQRSAPEVGEVNSDAAPHIENRFGGLDL